MNFFIIFLFFHKAHSQLLIVYHIFIFFNTSILNNNKIDIYFIIIYDYSYILEQTLSYYYKTKIYNSMNNSKRIKQIENENLIWIIYLFIIFFSFYANKLEKDYFINRNISSKNKYRTINTIIFITLVIIYSYFEKDALETYNNKDKLSKLSLIATTLVLISGLLFLYIIIEDVNIDEEIAFN